jgi:hypothetical protein
VESSFLMKASVEVNRRSLFKSLFALPIVFLGSKLIVAEPEPKQTVYWRGTNVPMTDPLYCTFGCGHKGWVSVEDDKYSVCISDVYGVTRTRITIKFPNTFDLKYIVCPSCSYEQVPPIYHKIFMCGHEGFVSMKGNQVTYSNLSGDNKIITSYSPIPKYQYVYDCPDCEIVKQQGVKYSLSK